MDGADGRRTTLDKYPKRLMKLFMAAIASVPLLFYRGLKASARELIQIIHKSIHENGNRQRKQNRASNRVDCSFAEEKPFDDNIWSRSHRGEALKLRRSERRLSTWSSWVFKLRTSYCSFAFLDSQPLFHMVLHATRRPRHFVVGLIFSSDKKNGPKFPI